MEEDKSKRMYLGKEMIDRAGLGYLARHDELYKSSAMRIYEDMMRESHKARMASLGLARETEMFKTAAARQIAEMEGILEPIRLRQAEIARAMEFAKPDLLWQKEIGSAALHMSGLLSQEMAANKVAEEMTRAHRTWLAIANPYEDKAVHLHAAANAHIIAASKIAAVSEHLYSKLDLLSLGGMEALSHRAALDMEHAINNMTSGYERLGRSLQTLPDVTRLPSFALPSATQELFLSGYATKQVSNRGASSRDEADERDLIVEIEKETVQCLSLLQEIDPALARPYIGAKNAFRSDNADRTRHILSSLRELWNHLLRFLAPDDMVMKWMPVERDLLHLGRPTRRARVLYVCRNLNHEPLSTFVFEDTRALVALIDLFNRVHELEPNMTDSQLKALLLRTESWIIYLLKIDKTSN